MEHQTLETYQRVLDAYLAKNAMRLESDCEATQSARLKKIAKGPLPKRLRKRFWRYYGYFERMITGTGSKEYWVPGRGDSMLPLDAPAPLTPSQLDIAVHLHVYFLDLLPELLHRLQNINQPFTCYVTTDSGPKAAAIETVIEHHPLISTYEVILAPNRGRDIAPWICEMTAYNTRHDLWCHVHTKKSIHIGTVGDQWRTFLLDQMLGSSNSVRNILSAFEQEPCLGVVIPPFFSKVVNRPFNEWENRLKAIVFFDLLGIDIKLPKHPMFSAGSMFWYRSAALERLFLRGLGYNDFEPEASQLAGTLAHIIERSLVYIAKTSGFNFKVVMPE